MKAVKLAAILLFALFVFTVAPHQAYASDLSSWASHYTHTTGQISQYGFALFNPPSTPVVRVVVLK
jgi:hypothetical protein